MTADLPDTPATLDPIWRTLGRSTPPRGRSERSVGITKRALEGRRRCGSVFAMRSGDGMWLYPAWQFAGDGRVHGVLGLVLKALRGMERWQAGVWLVADHPGLGGVSPRQALRDGVPVEEVAQLGAHYRAMLAA